MRKLIAAAAMLAAFALAGCNTVQGMGKDIEKAGEAIQKSAK
jgi:predicted small secreted protein